MNITAILLSVMLGSYQNDTIPLVKGYAPAAFPDSNRVARLKKAIPIVEKMYRDFAKQNNIPGLAFGIVGGGELIASGGIGFSNVEKNIAVSPASVYRIASMSKSFAGMAIIKLRDQGKLELDDPVTKYIPEMKTLARLTDDSPPITIRNLVSHTAGFPEDNPWGDRQLQDTDKEFVDFLSKQISLSNIPGAAYEYSNLGFTMLGLIITRASGVHYEQYIRQEIWEPLGMKNTYWEYSESPANLLANGYRLVNGKWVKEELLHSGAYGIMGGMLTSINDFSKYMLFHLSAWPARSGKDTGILKRSSVRQMHSPGNISWLMAQGRNMAGNPCPRIGSYNFGLSWVKDCDDKLRISHSGGLPGFGTHWTIMPDYDLGIVSFCNLTYAASVALNNKILDTLLLMADLQPRKTQAAPVLEQRKRELVNLLPNWDTTGQAGIFSENFFADYFIDSLRKQSKALFQKTGKILRVGQMIPDNQLRGNFIMEGEFSNIQVRFTLSPESPALIQFFSIREQARDPHPYKKYGLNTVTDIREYRNTVENDPARELVALDKFIPGLKLDIRYATSDNFMKKPMYSTAAAFLRRPAAEALVSVQKELKKKGLGLKIFDAYRPYSVTVAFYETYRDSVFVASPYRGSRHNRGCAVDLTIIDLKTGKELSMPTAYDAFTKEAHSNYSALPAEKIKNRELLKYVMTANGFLVYPDEWWHFDFKDWKDFPLMNISFEQLLAEK